MTDYILKFAAAYWMMTCQMAPYLLFGFLLAGILSTLISPEYVEKHLGKKGFMSILKGSLLGIPLPICSCGVIPLTASLKKHGASKGATVSFLTSTPQTGVDSIFVTYSMLGPVFAIFRPLAALVSGLLTGSAVELLSGKDENKPQNETSSEENNEDSCCDSPKQDCCNEPKDTCCSKQENKIIHILKYGFGTLLSDIAIALIIGLALAALIAVIVPKDWISGTLGTGLLSMVTVMLFGIPLYICSTASVPMALAMMMKGLSPGAALVFLITGTATNAVSVATIWRILGKKSTIVYLATIVITSLALGYLLNAVYAFAPSAREQIHHHESLSWFSHVCGGLLTLLIAYQLLKKVVGRFSAQTPQVCEHESLVIAFTIKGLTCNNCLNKAKETLLKLDTITSVSIDLKSGQASAQLKQTPSEEIRDKINKAIDNIGYQVEF